MLFKDKPDINHKTAEKNNLQELSQICRKACGSPKRDSILKQMLGPESKQDKKHNDKHVGCSMCKTGRETEKRICRCMHYYGKETEKCRQCQLLHKWINIGKITITDYEIPSEYVIKGVGGIDLILDGRYGAEVKGPKSKETLSRMIAETLTCTIETDYEPAIAFFEGSDQWKAYNKYKNEAYMKDILKYVAVFVIRVQYMTGVAEYSISKI